MTIIELCDRADLNEEARELARPNMPVREYIHHLARGDRLRDAIRALAQLFRNVDCVAWGLASIRKVSAIPAKPPSVAALEAVEQWLADPTEAGRRNAEAASGKAGLGTPAGLLAMAVFMSGGSMAPPDSPVAPEPAPHLCARAVTGAMALAVAWDPRNAPALLRAFLDHGFQLADQLKIWEEEK